MGHGHLGPGEIVDRLGATMSEALEQKKDAHTSPVLQKILHLYFSRKVCVKRRCQSFHTNRQGQYDVRDHQI